MANTEDGMRVTFKQLFDEFWKTDSAQAKVAKDHGCGKEDVSVCMRVRSFSNSICTIFSRILRTLDIF
jgi:hypothetical protein